MNNIYVADLHFNPESEIYHHGVMGMKWGIRRYQPYSLVPRKSGKGGKEQGAAKKGKVSAGKSGSKKVSSLKGNKVVKKSRNQKSADAKAAVEQKAKTARQRKEELEKVVNSGDAKLVYEHKNELTKKQLDAAIERINTEAKLKSLVSAQNPGKLAKLKDFAQKVDDVNSVVKTGVNAYKTADEIVGIAKGIREADTKAKKAEASAKVLKEIIDAGADAKNARELQSKLSDGDLKKLRERVKSLDEIGKVERSDSKRARDEAAAAKASEEKAAKRQADYLKKSLSDLEKARRNDDNRFDEAKKQIDKERKDQADYLKKSLNELNDYHKKTNFDNVKSSKTFDDYYDPKIDKASKQRFKEYSKKPEFYDVRNTSEFDKYFESQVKKKKKKSK